MPLTPRNRLLFHIRGGITEITPRWIYRREADRALRALSPDRLARAEARADYYCRAPLCATAAGGDDGWTRIGDIRFPLRERERHTGYYFPMARLLKAFPPELHVRYRFGDVDYEPDAPTLVKSRPIGGLNGVVLPLNAARHFRFVTADPLDWADKRPMLVGRNEVHWKQRIPFMERWYGHPRTNLGQVNTSGGRPDLWLRPRMSVDDQLQYKFIACIEGNDVATNLKWVMSSNSLPVSSPITCETWFMEGTLTPGRHFVDIKADFSDLLERMDYYLSRPALAREIIQNNHLYIKQFADPDVEHAAALLTLRRYFAATGQTP